MPQIQKHIEIVKISKSTAFLKGTGKNRKSEECKCRHGTNTIYKILFFNNDFTSEEVKGTICLYKIANKKQGQNRDQNQREQR